MRGSVRAGDRHGPRAGERSALPYSLAGIGHGANYVADVTPIPASLYNLLPRITSGSTDYLKLMQLRLFQTQLLEQCQSVVVAAQGMNLSISKGVYGDDFWRYAQAFVTAAANINKLLWGQRGKYADQRKALRESVGVRDDSPLKTTTMRNHFEHIDERLDKWWSESTTRNHVDRSVGPPDMIHGLTDLELFRGFDPATLQLRFWGDRYDLQEIVDEVVRILPAVAAEEAKSHWEPDS